MADSGLRLTEDPPDKVRQRLHMLYRFGWSEIDPRDALDDLRALAHALEMEGMTVAEAMDTATLSTEQRADLFAEQEEKGYGSNAAAYICRRAARVLHAVTGGE